ncbi:MAG: M28 family peptidase [Thermoguttaceae bacterium]|jgi:hypothetical protein
MSRSQATSPRRISGQAIYLAGSIMVGVVVIGALLVLGWRGRDGDAEGAVSAMRLEDIPFDGARAYEDLKQLVAIGPRRSGSPAMTAQQNLLAEHFRKLGAAVEFQRFTAPDPRDGAEVPMANIIVHWHPDSKERILLCAHYDTLPLPYRDPKNPRGVFVGANDNASGVAILMELGREMAKWPSAYGIDFALLDGEEFIFTEQDHFFRGSEYFARSYAKSPDCHYRWGVLLDMVGSANLHIAEENNSYRWADTRPLVDQIWATARRLGVREFVPKREYEFRDDHLPLHDIGKIPTCDMIGWPYLPWHTEGDTADKCSALSLAKVGWVLGQWLKTVPGPPKGKG